jgi:hypothetical protein
MATSNYKAIVTERTSPSFGQMVANTKTPNSKYKGMTKEQFTEATKYISCFTISIIEF